MRRLPAPARKQAKRPTQLQKLRARLREAEETLEAIQSGAIDGLVINSPTGPSVYTLKGADHAYRLIIENMQEGAATLTPGGAFAYCNRRFAELLGAPLECVVGHQVQEFLVSTEPAEQLLARAGSQSVFIEAELRRTDGSPLPVHLALSPLPSEDGPCLCVVATDLSEKKRRDEETTLLRTLASAVTEAEGLEQALTLGLGMICRVIGWDVGEVWQSSPSGGLVQRAAWVRDGARFGPFIGAGRYRHLVRPSGLCGLAWSRRAPVWVEALVEEPVFVRQETAAAAGVQTGLAVPLIERGEPTAVLNFFSTVRQPANARLIALVCAAASQLSSALQRKRAEQQLRESLHEKEVLLREVHHRVKNNLQLISSLLNMQARRADDSAHREMLRESRDRVQSIALVHEKLYRSKDLGRIELGRYLADLTTGLVEAYGGRDTVEVQVTSEEVDLAVDVAIPCALIVNELVSNALKHAFPNGRTGHLTVELLRVDGAAQISVKDDGVGMDPGSDRRPSRSLGLELVRTLCEELRGELLVKSGEGTTFTVRFPYQREKGWMP